MNELFWFLGESDVSMIQIMKEVEELLGKKAVETLDLLDANNIKAVRFESD